MPATTLPAAGRSPAPNRLFYGDNLDVLRSKFAAESVDLCCIDPPFNSKRSCNQIYTWTWDTLAIAGFDEILSNLQSRFQPRLSN
jgi:site-specific DNA-methyltransferase (adenine-specific)